MANLMEQILNSETIQQIRFRGILGKLTLVAVVCIVGAVLEIRSASDWHVQLAIIVFAGLIVLAILTIVGIYSLRHPHHVTLEGSEVIAFTRLQMATKDDPAIAINSRKELSDLSAGTLIGGGSSEQ
jgi:hypothetical protein